MENVPWHEEVVTFVKQLGDLLPDYEIASEHEHSNCVLLAHKKVIVGLPWQKVIIGETWISYIGHISFLDYHLCIWDSEMSCSIYIGSVLWKECFALYLLLHELQSSCDSWRITDRCLWNFLFKGSKFFIIFLILIKELYNYKGLFAWIYAFVSLCISGIPHSVFIRSRKSSKQKLKRGIKRMLFAYKTVKSQHWWSLGKECF